MNVTIKSIAEKAGVSIGTVDRALNDRAGISAKTKQHVLAVAKELGYKPNVLAKTLVSKRAPVRIAVIIRSQRDHLFSYVAEGIEHADAELKHYGLDIQVFETAYAVDQCIEQQIDILQNITTQDFAGLVIAPVHDNRILTLLAEIQNNGMPIILLNSMLKGFSPLCYVGSDLYGAGWTAAHLCSLLMRNGENVALTGNIPSLILERVDGFQDYLAQIGKPPCPVISHRSDESHKQDVLQLLKENPSISVLCHLSVRGTEAVLDAIRQCGRRVFLICFDVTDLHAVYLKSGEITSLIDQDPYTQGYQAVKLLFDYLYFHTKPKIDVWYTKTEVILDETQLQL